MPQGGKNARSWLQLAVHVLHAARLRRERQGASAVAVALNIPRADYEIGTTRLFFRTGKGEFLRELQHADPDKLAELLREKVTPRVTPS